MIDIKFRGISKETGEWIIGCLIIENPPLECFGPRGNNAYYIGKSGFADWSMPRPFNTYEVIPETIGQCSIWKDKEDVEIFEGDIIDIGQTVNGQSKFVINSVPCKLDIRYAYDINRKYEYDALDLMNYEDLKIVGNIYQKGLI